VLEDLHWCDHATVELIAWLARRPEPARLLLIGTYRPAEAIARAHPLRAALRELSLHGRCAEIRLDLLTEADVAAYLEVRFPGCAGPGHLAAAIHRRTDGNPLFLRAVCDALEAEGWLAKAGDRWEARAGADVAAMAVPASLRQLVEQRFDALGPADQELLESASVAGVEFSAAAAGAEVGLEAAESRCAALARQGQFLRPSGQETWPDGTASGRFRFVHEGSRSCPRAPSRSSGCLPSSRTRGRPASASSPRSCGRWDIPTRRSTGRRRPSLSRGRRPMSRG
jgi:predicted ATPase